MVKNTLISACPKAVNCQRSEEKTLVLHSKTMDGGAIFQFDCLSSIDDDE